MRKIRGEGECCPLDWKRSLLVALHKDADVELVGRGIALGLVW